MQQSTLIQLSVEVLVVSRNPGEHSHSLHTVCSIQTNHLLASSHHIDVLLPCNRIKLRPGPKRCSRSRWLPGRTGRAGLQATQPPAQLPLAALLGNSTASNPQRIPFPSLWGQHRSWQPKEKALQLCCVVFFTKHSREGLMSMAGGLQQHRTWSSFPGSNPVQLAHSLPSLQLSSVFTACSGAWARGYTFSAVGAEMTACVKTLEPILPSLLGNQEHQQGLPAAVRAAAVSAMLPAMRIKGTYGACACWHQRNDYGSNARGKC